MLLVVQHGFISRTLPWEQEELRVFERTDGTEKKPGSHFLAQQHELQRGCGRGGGRDEKEEDRKRWGGGCWGKKEGREGVGREGEGKENTTRYCCSCWGIRCRH